MPLGQQETVAVGVIDQARTTLDGSVLFDLVPPYTEVEIRA